MKDVLNDREGAKMVAVPVQRILNSTLDPLEVCLQTVVDEFVSQAARFGVRHLLPSGSDIQEPVQQHVESALNFFPYDHYVYFVFRVPAQMLKDMLQVEYGTFGWALKVAMANEPERA
eukprot:scaffold994_cov396-Pavlova_lutheri.AAC.7